MLKNVITTIAITLVIVIPFINLQSSSRIVALDNQLNVLAEAPSTATGGSEAEDRLDEIQKRLDELKKKKNDLNGSINAEKGKLGEYSSEISLISKEKALLENEIEEKELTIEELTLQIDILTKNITDTTKVVKKTEDEIGELEEEANKQLSSMYLDMKTYNTGLNLLFADGKKSIVKTELYQKTIQDDTNSALTQLNDKSEKLKEQKAKLEADKVKVEGDKGKIDEEKAALDGKKSQLQVKINRLWALYSDSQRSISANEKARASLSDEEAKLLSEQELIQQRIFGGIGEIKNGSYVKKGDPIGHQGLTGMTTGYHLHFGVMMNNSYQNPCGYLPAGVISGCAGNGSLAWPLKGTFYYTSGYGNRTIGGRTSFHAAIDIAHPTQNAPVYAAHDGWYIRGFEPCSSTYWLCKNGGANYVLLCQNKENCKAGLKTMYWHLK